MFRRASATWQLPSGYLFTSRDKPAAASGLLYGRATRALANYVENFTPFVAVALALIVTQRTGGSGALGATIWILARIVYIPLYLFGVVYARTAVWAISIVGLRDDAVAIDRMVAGAASPIGASSERDRQ